MVGVRLLLDGSEEAEDLRGAGKGREFIRRRLQSKEVIIFSRSVARSLIKVAAERNQQGPHQFYVSSFFLRESLPCSFIVKRSGSGDSLSNLITATFNWICDRRESQLSAPPARSDWRSSLSISHSARARPLDFLWLSLFISRERYESRNLSIALSSIITDFSFIESSNKYSAIINFNII